MPPEPQPRHGLKARPKLRARPAAPDGPGPAIRQSRASRHSRPASRRDHEPEAPAVALRRVRTTACDRSDARPAFIQRQVSCPRSSAPSCSPPARLSAGPDRSSSLQSVSIPVNSQKQGAPPSDPQFGRAGLCPDSGRDLGCAVSRAPESSCGSPPGSGAASAHKSALSASADEGAEIPVRQEEQVASHGLGSPV